MPSKLRMYIFAAMLVTYEFTTYVTNDMIMPGMPQVIREFHAPYTNVANSLTVYILGASLLPLILGPLSDRYGSKKIILSGSILFICFSLVLTLAPNIQVFMWGRFFQGGCMAFTAIGYSLIHKYFDDKDALKITSLMANVTILAPLIGPIIGALIVDYLSWRYVFVFVILLGFISLIGLIKSTPNDGFIKVPINCKQILNGYLEIVKLPQFLIGVLATSFLTTLSLLWVAESPILVMHTANLGLNSYMAFQLIAVSGSFLSSLLMQFIADRFNLAKIIYMGIYSGILGFIIGTAFYYNLLGIAFALCIYTFGRGFVSSTIMRVVGTLEVKSKNMLFSLLGFMKILIITSVLGIINHILSMYNYSLFSYAIANLGIGIITVILVFLFTKMNQHRLQ